MSKRFEIDPDIARSASLPPERYSDPSLCAAEVKHVFARTWQLAGRTSALDEVGAYVTTEIAGEPILIQRAAEGPGGLRGWYNVCPHRAGPLAADAGKRKTIQCGYHGWTFSLDGKLLHAPEMEGCDLSGFALKPVAVGAWGGLVFAAIDPLAGLEETFADVSPPTSNLAWVMARDYPVEADWKVYVDNYLEGYHIPIVHPELFRELDYDNYRTVTSRWSSRQFAPLRPLAPGRPAGERAYAPEFEGEQALYYWVFPNLMLNIYKGQLQTNLVLPVAPGRCVVRFEWFAEEPSADPARDPRWKRLLDLSDLLQAQDAAICSTVQRNLASRGARRGRYSPRRETGVHHFHSLLARLESMSGPR
jgi:choline monooxygenase